VKAVVLCAGLGTRLGSLTEEIPKPMLPLNKRPLLAYIIGHISKFSIKNIAINIHFKPEVIKNYFGNGDEFGVKITYFLESRLLGTAGALKNMENFVSADENFIVIYGDILTNQDLNLLEKKHIESNSIATLLLHKRQNSNSRVKVDRKFRIIEFNERPEKQTETQNETTWVNSGIAILNKKILNYIKPNIPTDLPKDIYSNIINTETLSGVPLTGYRCAIDSQQRYLQALEDMKIGKI
jgi:NDP-sugar pyrophosphorylase family protein